jgi:hypothetical protein
MKNYFFLYYTLTTLHYKTEMISSKKYLNFIYHNYHITYFFGNHIKVTSTLNLKRR